MTEDFDQLWAEAEEFQGGGQEYLREGEHEAIIVGAEVIENQYGPSILYHLVFPKFGDKTWQKYTSLSGSTPEQSRKNMGRAKTELSKLGVKYTSKAEMEEKIANDVVGKKLLINCKSRGEGKKGFWFNFVKVTGVDRATLEAQAVFGGEPDEPSLLVD